MGWDLMGMFISPEREREREIEKERERERETDFSATCNREDLFVPHNPPGHVGGIYTVSR